MVTYTNYSSDDREIEFNLQNDLTCPRANKRKQSSTNSMSLADLFQLLAFLPTKETVSNRWRKFTQLFSDQLFYVQSDKGQLIFTIETDKWFSNVCLEEDQLGTQEKVPAGQTYEFISAYTNRPEVNYFTIRRGLQGRVGEIVELKQGPLMSGSEALALCMRIRKFLKIERFMLNDDAKILGDGYTLELRFFQPVISPKPRTIYSDVGFVLWENNPHLACDKNGNVIEVNVQNQQVYNSAVQRVRVTKINRLSRLGMATKENMDQLKEFCQRYRIEFESATVQSMGYAINCAFKDPQTKMQASIDFRAFYEICFLASDNFQAKTYNKALDILQGYKYWIITEARP